MADVHPLAARKQQIELSKALSALAEALPKTNQFAQVRDKLASAAQDCKYGTVQAHMPVVLSIDESLKMVLSLDVLKIQCGIAMEKFKAVFPDFVRTTTTQASTSSAAAAAAAPPILATTGSIKLPVIGSSGLISPSGRGGAVVDTHGTFSKIGTLGKNSFRDKAMEDQDSDTTSLASSITTNRQASDMSDFEMYQPHDSKTEDIDDEDLKSNAASPPGEVLPPKPDGDEPEAPAFDLMIPEENNDDYYPYDEEDRADNINYNEHAKYSNIKAATLEKLIEKMTSDTYVDHNLNLRYVFLLTYRSFTSAEEILFKLSERFNVPTPLNITPSELEIFEQNSVKKIKLKSLGLIQYWIKEFFSDFEDRPILKSYLEDLLKQTFSRDPSYAKIASTLLELIQKQMAKSVKQKRLEGKGKTGGAMPKGIFIDNADIDELERKMLEMDPGEIAGQLTLKDFDTLKKIPAREFLDQSWAKKNKNDLAPRIMEMIGIYNRVSSWSQSFILSFEEESKRLQALRKVIYIAKVLRELNNFSSLAAIYYGIVATPIHRLKCSKKLNKNEIALMDEMAELFSNRQKGLRHAMEAATNPCVPHLSLFLGDLTFLDSNEDMIGGLINFRKRSMIAERIRWIKQAQQSGYGGRINADPLLQQYIESKVKIIHEEELYQMSIRIEPLNN